MLDSLELLMLFVGPLTHFGSKRFLLITFYNGTLLSIETLIVFNVRRKNIFVPPSRKMVDVIILMELLLLPKL
jgi:hypothetical protein